MKPHIVIFSVLFILCHFSFTQTKEGNLSYYIFPEFVDGVVLMKSGNENQLSINYNAVSEEMVFVKSGHSMAIGKTESELIDTIYMDKKKFIKLDGKFVEILYQSKITDLYVQYKCELEYSEKPISYQSSEEVARAEQSISYTTGLVSESKITYAYTPSHYVVYYLNIQGEIFEITSLRDLKKLFKAKQDMYKSYVKNNDIAFENTDQIVGLIRYLDLSGSSSKQLALH
ncbi:MAG: hypothetical protein RLQ12_10980 [Cyclobacteriaceae bacterium]